jgi:hypothetical protein
MNTLSLDASSYSEQRAAAIRQPGGEQAVQLKVAE